MSNLPGLSPLWLIALGLALGTLLLIAVPTVISPNAINPRDYISFAGSIFGAFITIIGLVVATNNLRRQIRINIVLREEERMEERLPGLREASQLVANLVYFEIWMNQPSYAIRALTSLREKPTTEGRPDPTEEELIAGPITAASIKATIPLADDRLIQEILDVVSSIDFNAKKIIKSEKRPGTDTVFSSLGTSNPIKKWSDINRQNFSKGLEDLRTLDKELSQRRDQYAARLTHIRSEIETYFDH